MTSIPLCNFPLCIDMKDARVLLVGVGPQTDEKRERLLPFQPNMVCLNRLTAADLEPRPAIVVAGDLTRQEAEHCYALCVERHIPINVVDVPELCTFYFPAIVKRGAMTVAVSSGGACPAAAVHIRSEIEQLLPEQTETVLDWLSEQRVRLKETLPPAVFRRVLKTLTEEAFSLGRPLTERELLDVLAEYPALPE